MDSMFVYWWFTILALPTAIGNKHKLAGVAALCISGESIAGIAVDSRFSYPRAFIDFQNLCQRNLVQSADVDSI